MLLVPLLFFVAQAGPGSPDPLSRAEDLFRKEQYAGAVQILRKVINAQPNSARAWAILGASLFKLGRYSEAEPGLASSLRLDPDRPEVLKLLGWLYYQTGRFEEAERVLRGGLRADPRDPEILYALGLTRQAQHDYAQAASIAQQALAIHPDDLASELLLGQALTDMRQYDNAEWAYRAALRLNEKLAAPSEKPYAAYGQLLFVLNRLDDAERMFTAALKVNPQSPAALIGRAHVLEDKQQHRAAQADAERALALMPDNEALHVLLLRIYVSLGAEAQVKRETEWLEQKNHARLRGRPSAERD